MLSNGIQRRDGSLKSLGGSFNLSQCSLHFRHAVNSSGKLNLHKGNIELEMNLLRGNLEGLGHVLG